MNSFVIVARKPGRHIPDHVLEFLRRADVPDLAFIPDDHVCWISDPGNVAIGCWQRSTDIVRFGSHWYVSEHGITTFAGRMWPHGRMWAAEPSWAMQLEQFWHTHPVVDAGQPLDGIFTAASIAGTGVGRVISDPLSVAMLYRAETDDFVAVATSARLAARIAAGDNREPVRDAEAVAWLTYIGNIVGDRTGFVGTRVLPVGSYVEIDPLHGLQVRYSNPTPWVPAEDLPTGDDELVDRVHRALSESVQSVARLPVEQRLADITGGRDSRLVLSLLIEQGLTDKFEFRTTGDVHTPDSSIGCAIAERFALNHRAVVPGAMDETAFRRRLRTHVFQTSGMFSAWDFKGSLNVVTTPTVSGMFGELARTKYKDYPFFESASEVRDTFDWWQRLDAIGILQPDVRNELRKQLFAELLERVDTGGSAPQDHLDAFYVRHRLRRWLGTTEELGESGRVFPLYSLIGLQGGFAIGAEKRWNEFLVFSIMRNACPDLAKMPLVKFGWPEAILADLSDADDYRTAGVKYEGPAPVQWQPQRLEDNHDVVEDYLLDEKSSPLYEIFDRNAVIEVLRGPVPTKQQQPQALFGALTAAVWLGYDESGYRIGDGWDQPVPLAPAATARAPPVGIASAAADGAGAVRGGNHGAHVAGSGGRQQGQGATAPSALGCRPPHLERARMARQQLDSSVECCAQVRRAEYEPDDVPKTIATKTVRAATEILAITQCAVATT